ncbi:MAG TPA: carboxypeptidase regulatory-like domain-containing protein [Candidatus Acidoferrum sp.]|nr:carboxypeptidase regulatory-like domain-containing protein [Candidatus Acidoferrum sp.]
MKNMFRSLLVLAAVVAFAALAMVPTYAQTSNGTIVGTVTDKTGAVVPQAKIKATSMEFGSERLTVADSVGAYRVENLAPGTYSVTVEASGFRTSRVENVLVKGSLEVTANATLEIGSITETVEVQASTGQELQTESGSLSGDISQQEIHDLPIQSGNPVELALTLPGVQDGNGFSFSNGVGFSVNGTRPRANNFLVDGQDNNDNSISGQAFQTTNLGAIQEVTVLTNAYSAEFGRGGGSVTNEIMKSGTNTYHGEAWWQNRNASFAAVPPQAALGGVTTNPRDNENVFGFNFGGPIKHDKLFFFGSAQWDRDYASAAADAATLTIPTAVGIAELNALLPNPNVQLLLSSLGGLVAPAYPVGTPDSAKNTVALGPDTNGVDRGSVELNNFVRSQGDVVALTREWEIRMDYNPTSVDSLRVSYRRTDGSFAPDFFNNPGTLPPYDTQQGGPAQAFTAMWGHTFSNRAINELRFSYSNIEFNFGPTAASLANPLANTPGISFNGSSGLPGIGIPTGDPQFRGHKSYQFQDALSYTVGRHTFKFGGDIDYLKVDDGIPFNSRGTISFFPTKQDPNNPAITPYTDLANFIDNYTGPSGAVSINFGNSEIKPKVGIYAPYVEDTWHVKSNFTATLGLRYEYWGTVGNILPYPSLNTQQLPQGVPGAVFPNFYASKQQGDKNNFAPRIGLAYTPKFLKWLVGDDKTVIRAGYGIFYDGIFTNILDNTASSVPNVNGGSQIAPSQSAPNYPPRGLANATGLLSGLTPVADPTAITDTMASHILNPLTHQWNLDVQRELPGGFILTAAYVGTRGEHLFANQEFNPLDPNTGLRLNQNFSEIVVRDNAGDSDYHSGQFTLDRKFSHGLLLRAAYTYSKLIDDASEVFTNTGGSSFSQDVFNQKGDYGLSAYDRRHRFVLTYIWDLPYTHNEDNAGMKVLSQVTRGWQWAGTLTLQTGAPETIYDGIDANGDGHSGNDRPSLANPKVPINYSSACLNPNGTCDSGVGFSFDGTTFVDFNSSYGFDPNTGAFTAARNNFHYVVVVGQNGDLGRNTFIGPGQFYFNTSVQRSFKFLERQSLTLRIELFNAFNHPNLFTDGGLNSFALTSSHFEDIASTIGFTNGFRQVKFWLKYAF